LCAAGTFLTGSGLHAAAHMMIIFMPSAHGPWHVLLPFREKKASRLLQMLLHICRDQLGEGSSNRAALVTGLADQEFFPRILWLYRDFAHFLLVRLV
jgi:hypothetical protein